jgi:formate hydrogenlyase subunit 6/NADH:ubiquinone oxidoreductase subunit I
MPAGNEEIEDALEEGVELLPLVQVIQLERSLDDSLVAVVTRRMRLGGREATGRRRPIPISGSEKRFEIDSLIEAISQHPDLEGFDECGSRGGWLLESDTSGAGTEVLAGGDVIGLGIAGKAIVQGRLAAERLHDRFQGVHDRARVPPTSIVGSDRVKFESRSIAPRAVGEKLDVDERLRIADAEVTRRITEGQLLAEAERCVSCGSCLGCGQCAMFCTTGCYKELLHGSHGNYFELSMDRCHECGKCIEVCPSGFLEAAEIEP